MAALVLGPVLRWADDSSAVVWVECDGPCEVEVLGCRSPTFAVDGHHFAVVVVGGLEPGRDHEYEVRLDGERVWPDPRLGVPPSSVRTRAPGEDAEILVGSCRNGAPLEAPYALAPGEHPAAVGADALHRAARRLARRPEERPALLLLVGDQVYADADPTGRREPPLLGFRSHARLYHEAWREPWVRWLLSVVPSAMVWDDHEVIDDWNISASWVEARRGEPGWDERITGAIGSYWVYQHLGNLPPEEMEASALLAELRAADDGWPALRSFARSADVGTAGTQGSRWSHARDVGPVRLVVVDSRNGRVLDEERWMNDAAERAWVEEQATTDRHLAVASSVPVLLPPALHRLERWSEATADGAWGRWFGGPAERLRQLLDLEHWPAFGRSFDWLEDLVVDGVAGRCPRTTTLVSGDVHFAYVAPARVKGDPTVAATQVVTSPLRNAIGPKQRAGLRFALSPAGRLLGHALLAGVPARRPRLRWDIEHGPWFTNNLARLRYPAHGSAASVTIEVAPADRDVLEVVLQHDLDGVSRPAPR